MEVLELIEKFGLPLVACGVLLWGFNRVFSYVMNDLVKEIDHLKDIIIKLIDSNTQLKNKVMDTRSDISTVIEFLKNGKK